MRQAGRVAHQNYYCLPLVVETMDTWCIDAIKRFNKLRKRISQTNQDLSLKETKPKKLCAIQRGNDVAVI